MKCANCPLFSSWNNESDKGESCGLFGDGWDNDLQYEDKNGSIIGCYVERRYIMKAEKRYQEYLDNEVECYLKWEEEQNANGAREVPVRLGADCI